MKSYRRTLTPVAISLSLLIAAACSSNGSQQPSNTGSSSSSSTESGNPSSTGSSKAIDLASLSQQLRTAGYDQIADSVDKAAPAPATLKDGSEFHLATSIADKVKKGDPINYVFSYQSSGIALFSDQYKTGYDKTLPIANSALPMQGKAIAPSGDIDIQKQISQIEALLNTNQIDCLAIEPPDSNAFTSITNKAMAKGIPVFTAGVTSNGNEFANFTQVPIEEGHTAAKTVLDWMAKNGKTLKVFTTSGGDPTSFWGQGRMKGFEEGIKEKIPDAKFINTASNPLNVGYDSGKAYDAYKALLTGHPDLQFILNVDITAEQADRAIKDAGKTGSVFTAGWNLSGGQLDAIESGTQVAAFDQAWSQQSGYGAVACAVYLATGKVAPNTQHLNPVTKDNAQQARDELDKVLKK